VSLGLADIPRYLKISKHTGETNHLQYFDDAGSGRSLVARVNYFQMFVLV